MSEVSQGRGRDRSDQSMSARTSCTPTLLTAFHTLHSTLYTSVSRIRFSDLNMNTNILAYKNILNLTFFGDYEYKSIWIQYFRQNKKEIYSGLPKMGKFEYKYNYLDWYFQIRILALHSTLYTIHYTLNTQHYTL